MMDCTCLTKLLAVVVSCMFGWIARSMGVARVCPKIISCGVFYVDAFGVAFIANAAYGNASYHESFGLSVISVRSTCSRVLWTLSVCPSVCGWCAVLAFDLVPSNFHNSTQNADTNLGSLSWTSSFGTPYIHTICLKNNVATLAADS